MRTSYPEPEIGEYKGHEVFIFATNEPSFYLGETFLLINYADPRKRYGMSKWVNSRLVTLPATVNI